MISAALCHSRLWIDAVFIYVIQQVGPNKGEVAQFITLHRYEWKQEVHTDL